MEEIKPRVELFCLVTPECKRYRCGLYVFNKKQLNIYTEGWDCDLDFVMGLAFVALLIPRAPCPLKAIRDLKGDA